MRISPVFLAAALLACAVAQTHAQEPNPESRQLPGHDGSVVSVAFSRDGKTLVSGGRDDLIHVWDVATGELKKTLTNHRDTGKTKGDIYSIAFSHDGKLMASGSMDTTIILWDARTFEAIRTLHGHTGAVRCVTFSPDDQSLASGAEDNTFRLWEVSSGKLKVTRTEHTGKAKGVVYFPRWEKPSQPHPPIAHCGFGMR